MDPDITSALSEQLLAMADDELILGHRDAEWCGHAPILEEDIAFANIALDELGHATLWYGLVAGLEGKDPETYPDQMVFNRDDQDFRNIQLVELPKGDWAFSMLRQYLFDAAESIRLGSLAQSQYQPLAEAAAKIQKEETYHYRHTAAWIRRLGMGTEESHRRLQNALDQIWPYTWQLFTPLPGENRLVEASLIPSSETVLAGWRERVLPVLQECELIVPATSSPALQRDQHTQHLKVLVSDMQSVARLDQQATW